MSDMLTITPKEAVALGATSLTQFGRLFLPKTFRQTSPAMHEEMGQALYSPVRQNMFLVFRDGAKTTLLRAFILQRVCYGISFTILVISASQDHSIHTIRWLKRQIERNSLISGTFQLKPGSKWTDEWISIENVVLGQTINILAAGITGQVRGFNLDDFRPDLILCDDILTDESTKTPEGRKKTEDLFHGAIVNSLAAATESPLAKVVLLQTPFHDDDLAMKCSNDPAWNPIVYGILDDNDKSRWESKFPTAAVHVDREAAFKAGRKRVWMREKACKIVKTEDVHLNSDLLKYWTQIPAKSVRLLIIDPASSDSTRADDNVVMTIAISGMDVYVLRYNATKNTMPDEAASYFFQHARDYAPLLKAGVEGVSYQRTLKWYIEREMRARRLYVPIVHIDDRRSKADKILQNIPQLLAYGHLWIHPSMTSFITQMDDYDPAPTSRAHDDILDALAMGINLAGALLQSPYTIDNTGNIHEIDESDYPALTYTGGCP